MWGRRVACLYVPALPLQLLVRRQRLPSGAPVAVLHGDRVGPQVAVWLASRAARRGGVVPGMRLSQARSLVPDLHADVWPAAELAAATRALAADLGALSPYVAPDPAAPGVVWLDPNGLEALLAHRGGAVAPTGPGAAAASGVALTGPSSATASGAALAGPGIATASGVAPAGPGSPAASQLARWAASVVAAAAAVGLVGRVVVGYRRVLVHALAAAGAGAEGAVCASPEDERRLAATVPLARLALPAARQAALAQLGLVTLGDLWQLRRAALAVRLGPEVAALIRAAGEGGSQALPPPCRPAAPLRADCALEPPDDDASRLLFAARRLLLPLLADLHRQAAGCAGLTLTLAFDRRLPPQTLVVAPASPCCDETLLGELLRLRLFACALPAPVAHLTLEAAAAPTQASQVPLLGQGRTRPLAAAQAAWARLRAAFGPGAVTCARLCAVHLPEGRYRWEAADPDLSARPPPAPALPPLLRRLSPRPQPLRQAPRIGAPLGGYGGVTATWGPFRLDGGWWTSRPTVRDYLYVACGDGRLLWAFCARPSNRWYLQGLVD